MARPDLRNHISLVDDKKLEWLGDLSHEQRIILNSIMQEAEEFADQDLMLFCQRYIRLGAAVRGKRAELMAKVAMHDEARRDAVESRAPASSPEVPRGP